MKIQFFRSSLYNSWDWCQHQTALQYAFGFHSKSGIKAAMGTITHKALQIIADQKLAIQNGQTSIDDPELGKFDVDYNDIDKITARAFAYYEKIETHLKLFPTHLAECIYNVKKALDYCNGLVNPKNKKIVATEQFFDFAVDKPWSDDLRMKGTIDLITEISDNIYEVIDYKGLPLSTKIPTTSGFCTMEHISIGDKVFDQYGRQCNVIGKSRVKTKKCYKIYFDDTTSVSCDDEHLWKLSNGEVKIITDLKIGDKINVAKSIECDEVNLPIDPYLLGAWLGDGRNRNCEITCGDNELFDIIKNLGFSLGKDSEKRKESLQTRTILKQTYKFRNLNLLNNKHIPDIYFRASIKQRLRLLQGLMDTDGSVNETRKQCVFSSCDKRLSDDVKHLLLTLGQRPYQASVITNTNFKKNVPVYPISFRPLDINPFLLSRKRKKIGNWGYGLSSVRKIIRIENSIIQKTQCISVDSKDNTYLCTENYIPTHNTGKRIDWATGEEKTEEKLKHDPQLLIYFFALKRLYPDKDFIFSIFYINDGGLLSTYFDNASLLEAEDMLKRRYIEICSTTEPKLLSNNQTHWKCQKLCQFAKEEYKNTGISVCEFMKQAIRTIGLEKSIARYGNHDNIGNYGAGGGTVR